jgi:hypothetical protein
VTEACDCRWAFYSRRLRTVPGHALGSSLERCSRTLIGISNDRPCTRITTVI